MPINFSDVGLVEHGANQREVDDQNIARGAQQVETGRIGLEELTRQSEQAKRYRSAVSAGTPADGSTAVYHRLSKEALASGDADTYAKAQEASKKLQDEGIGQIAMGALTGQPVDQVEKQFNQIGSTRIVPGSLEYGRDPKTGDILARGISVTDGKPYTVNATQYGRLHGLIKQQVHTIPAGGALAITEPGRTTEVVEGKNKTFSPSQAVIHVERTSEDGGKKTYAYDMEKKEWIGGAPPGEAGAPPEAEGGGSVRKNLPVLKAVDEAISKIPGAVNKMDLSDPLHPYYEWTPKGQAYSVRAQKLYLANPKLPPEQIREIVSSPELQARIVDGEESELRYKGKTYKLGNVAAAAPAQAAPAAQPASGAQPAPAAAPAAVPASAAASPAPAAQKPEAKPAPRAVQADVRKSEKASAEPAKDDSDLPAVVTPGASPKAQYESRVAAERAKQDAKRAASQSAKSEKEAQAAVENFRVVMESPTMSQRDIPVIEQAIKSGKLKPEEASKANRMLAKLRG